jgi:hypothetical protein
MNPVEDPIFCRCCLAGLTKPVEHALLDMRRPILVGDQQQNIYDGYVEGSGIMLDTLLEIPIQDTKICQSCCAQLHATLNFRAQCKAAVEYLQAKFTSELGMSSSLITDVKEEVESYDDSDFDQYNDDDDDQPNLLENNHFLEFEMKEEGEVYFDEDDSMTNYENDGLESQTAGNEETETYSMTRLKQKFTCSICAKVYRNKRSAEKHIKNQHANDTVEGHIIEEPSNIKYRCEVCLKVCKQYSSLYDHLKRVHNTVNFSCKLCDKHFKTHTGLQLHNKAQHLQLKFPCEFCLKVFNRKCNLLGHVKMEHQGIRQICKLCEKSFRTTQDLWIHSFDHRGFRP